MATRVISILSDNNGVAKIVVAFMTATFSISQLREKFPDTGADLPWVFQEHASNWERGGREGLVAWHRCSPLTGSLILEYPDGCI